MSVILLAALIQYAQTSGFCERHLIADAPYSVEQEDAAFRRLEAVEKLYEQHREGK